MNNLYRSIFFLKSFAGGLLMPVMSLMVMARGVSVGNLALVIGVYSLTVIVLEFPSGVFSDLAGRKKTFLLSCVLMFSSLLVILAFGKGTAVLSVAFLIQGAGRAFASGSLDALVIERSLKLGGDSAVAKTSGELGVLECAGIAVGSLAGGFLGGIGNLYSVNLAVMAGIYILLGFLVIMGVKEHSETESADAFTHYKRSDDSYASDSTDISMPRFSSDSCTLETADASIPPTGFRSQMWRCLHFSWKCVPIRLLMILIFFTGIVLFSVETYWQPGLLRLFDSEKIWLMGVVSFLGFGLTALSSQLGAKLLQHFSQKDGQLWWRCLFLTKLLFGAGAAFFGLWVHPALFICNYSVFYFIHGGGSVIENAILSKYTANEMRASVMSLFSLIFQFGGLTASALSGSLLSNTAMAGIWLAFGSAMVLCTLGAAIYQAAHS